jgi:adenylylsulfate kinase
MYIETKARSIAKTVSWRFWATITTMAVVFLIVGETAVALSIGFFEVTLKLLIYFFHERAWNKIKYGRREINPAVIWLTGYVRSGKSDIAKKVIEKFKDAELKVEHLDGHTIRDLFPQTGFSEEEVNQHIERVGYLASRLEKQGVFVVASFVSPYKLSREWVRDICGNFFEIHISTPLEVCEERDDSGIYRRAREGEVGHFPGISSEYQPPDNPALKINAAEITPDEAADKIFNHVKNYF